MNQPRTDGPLVLCVFAPAAVPVEIVGQLGEAVLKAVQMPDVQERLLQVGSEPAPGCCSFRAASPRCSRRRSERT